MNRISLKKILSVLLILSMLFATFSVLCVTTKAAQNDGPVRYGYTTASENVKYVYDRIVEAIMADTPVSDISLEYERRISAEETQIAIFLVMSDYPECFWLENSYGTSKTGNYITLVRVYYSFTGSALTQAKADMEAAISEFMEGMPTNGTNYEKALFLHDAVATKVTYDLDSEYNQSAYSALVNRSSVCAGYAEAYQLLLRRAGIQAWTVTGSSRNVNHAWNVVWLDDNTCVYTDVTWDDPEDNLFRAYFNLSKAEMAVDHEVNKLFDEDGEPITVNTFVLPDCSHDDQSYFDVNSCELTLDSSVEEIAALLGPASNGKRTAIVYATDAVVTAWVQKNWEALYWKAGGLPGSIGSDIDTLHNEKHINLYGDFSTPGSHYVSIGVRIEDSDKILIGWGSGSVPQTVSDGMAIDKIIIVPNEGYYFPADYTVAPMNGVSVQRKSHSELWITGTPTGTAYFSLPAPTYGTPPAEDPVLPPVPTQPEPTPTATFTATGYDTGTLSGVSNGMAYRIGLGSWKSITTDTDTVELSGLTAKTIYIKKLGDGTTTTDSAAQSIQVTRAATPNPTVTQPSSVGGKGGIATTTAHQYSKNKTTWTDCTGAMTNLSSGTYYVRVKATGTVLASDYKTITINEYTPSVISVSGVSLDAALALNIGDTSTLNYTVLPSNATNQGVSFSSSNPTVATVDPYTGLVTGVSRGTAIITITTDDGSHTDTCVVTVSCEHDFSDTWSKNYQKHWHECSCGEKDDEADHSFGDWSVVDPATPSQNGSEKRTCVCGHFETRELIYVPDNSDDDHNNGNGGEGTGNGGNNTNTGGNTGDGDNAGGGNVNNDGNNTNTENTENQPEATDKATEPEANTEKGTETDASTEEETADEEELSVGCEATMNSGAMLLVVLCVLMSVVCFVPKKENN